MSPASSPALSRLESLPLSLLISLLHYLPLPVLIFSLKPISRTLYAAASAIARELALPLWREEVRAAEGRRSGGGAGRWSTDPLGGEGDGALAYSEVDSLPVYVVEHPQSSSSSRSLLASRSRELAVLDLFIVSLARSALLLERSTLFSAENDSSELSASRGSQGGGSSVRQDLFGLLQPRARVEDLVVREGRRRGVVVDERGGAATAGGVTAEADGRDAASSSSSSSSVVLADDIRVELKTKDATLLLPFRGSHRSAMNLVWKVAVRSTRGVNDGLEEIARKLVDGLARTRLLRLEEGGLVYYCLQ